MVLIDALENGAKIMAKLHRRGPVYYVVINVPTDLHAAMGCKQKWISLRTKDRKEATRRQAAVIDEWMATFDELSRRRDLNDADIAGAVWEHYTSKTDEGDRERASRPTTAQIDDAIEKAGVAAIRSGAHKAGPIAMINAMTEVETLANKATWAARRRAARLNRLRSDLASGDTRLIEPDADRFLAKHGFTIEHGSELYRELCHKLMRADIEQLERYAERDRGDYTGKPKDPIVVEPAEMPDMPDAGGDRIMPLFAKYEAENPNSIRPETFKQTRRDVQHFSDFVGPRVRVSKIDRRMVREWKDLLTQWPVKAADTAAFEGLSVKEIIAANNRLERPKPAITRNTIRRYMASLSGFCRWLVVHDYLAANPVTDMLPKKNGPANKRRTFTDDALSTLFTSPLFTTCKSDVWRDVDKPGNVAVRDHRYWIPYVMLYSGARPGEIAQLHVDDVRQTHGVWIMHITEEGEGRKRTKTKGSMRVVPIHDELTKLGFVEHCQRMAAAGHKQVFPEVDIPEEGQVAAAFSREFNRYLAKIGVKTGTDIVTYSLRHTFIGRARDAGFLDEEIGTVVGHDKPTMTGRYGTEHSGSLKRRATLVNNVRYPTIEARS